MQSYWWFSGASVQALVDQIGAKGGATNVRLEAHPHDDGKLTFRVLALGTRSAAVADDPPDGCAPINDSHICPPDCG